MSLKIYRIEYLIIFLLVISQILTYTIFTILFPINDSILQIFKYLCIFLPIIYLFKGFKIEIKMLFVILIFLTSILINDIDPKFNSEVRFATWIVMIAMIGPLFYSYHLNLFKEKLLNTFMYVFMILGAISFIYWLFGFPSLGRGHFSGLFNHSMVLSPISSMGVLFSIYKFYKSETNFLKYFYFILFIFNFLALILSASRSALAAVLIALFIFLLFAKIRYKKIFLFFGILVGIIANSFISLNLEKNNLTQSITTRGFDNTREILWHDRLLEFKSSPFFGVGFAAQDDNIKGKIGKKGSEEGVVEPGSAYLMILSMTGLLGTIVLLIFFSKYILSLNFWEKNLFNINYKFLLFIFFSIHFIAEGYIFSSGSIFSFIFWLLVASTYPNSYNYKENIL
jgi:O-antigen ligase